MRPPKFLMAALLLCAVATNIRASTTIAKDDASQSTYSGGWNESGGGQGFGDWKFHALAGANDSFAGRFIASGSDNPEKAPVTTEGRAFGLYANGAEFEASAAFRPFSKALKTGDTFSFQMVNLVIERKGTADSDAAGAVGLTLRNGNAADSHDDYNKNSRFEIINLKGEANYQIYDGESTHDSGVAFSDQGISVTVTLTGSDTYDLTIVRLIDYKTTKLAGRKLAGSGAIESFCIFDRNGEKADGFFNKFEVSTGK